MFFRGVFLESLFVLAMTHLTAWHRARFHKLRNDQDFSEVVIATIHLHA
jgi:hypothetical protein